MKDECTVRIDVNELESLVCENEELKRFQVMVFDLINGNIKEVNAKKEKTHEDYLQGKLDALVELKLELIRVM